MAAEWRQNLRRSLFATACACVAGLGLATSALAELRICNDTGEVQSIALGFKGETDWTSKGWWNIKPSECATVVSGDLTKRYYYYFADSKRGEFRGQAYTFCADNSAFEIIGDTDCEKRGHEELSFREIDTGETALAFTLTLQASKSSEGSAPVKAPGGGEGSGENVTQTVSETPTQTEVTIEVASLDSDLPVGRHGDPIRTVAFFQGCELERGRAFCSFHASGVKYRVFYGGPTPNDMLYALEEMAVNLPVRLEADVLETRGQERAVVVRSVKPEPGGDQFATVRRAIQGDWIAAQDRRSAITILGSEIYVRYEGEFKAARFLQLAQSCNGLRGAGPVMLQTAKGENRAKCYQIAEAGSRLELIPVRGGETLRFRRP